MTTLSLNTLFPYMTLGLLVVALLVVRSRKAISMLMAAQIGFAFFCGIMNPTALGAVAIFWGICALHWRNPSTKKWLNSLRLFVIVAIAISFASHFVPGFHNLRLYSGLMITPTATPFTMYLNFDKTIAAVILVATSGLLLRQIGSFSLKSVVESVIIAALCVSLLVPAAMLKGYVNFEPKIPDFFWMWALNNLLFVCFAEEVIFRGIIQNYLMQYAMRWKMSPFIPIFISALLFALLLPGHVQGGPTFIAFATLSGLFYGYAYHRTHRLESAILVHFLVNLSHFLFFSYPMLASVIK